MSGQEDLMFFLNEDDGGETRLDPDGAESDIQRLVVLLTSGGLADYHNRAGEALAELHRATSDAYLRLVASQVMEHMAADLLFQRTFVEFPVVFYRVNAFVMTYRRLRPDWEAEQFMGGGND